jgi:3-hydroxypropanoate dehydrogenase
MMMPQKLPELALKQLFTEARSYHAWQAKPVDPALLKELYDLAKWGPTAVNALPARLTFITTDQAKERLIPLTSGSNPGQIRQAPVTVIVSQDTQFYNDLPRLFPAYPQAKELFSNDQKMAENLAFRNSSLQGAYLLMAARSLGLDVCPMSGFDNDKIDEEFFKGTSLKSNFIFTLGYGDVSKLYPRGPRYEFEEVARIL